MFTLEERHSKIYALYDFSLDELYWLLEYIPHEDLMAKDAKMTINELEQLKFEGKQVA